MATLHPTPHPHQPLNAGEYRERDVLAILERGLPAGYDVFHSVHWSSVHAGAQQFGEIDVVVVSPQGHLVLIEVKAGAVTVQDEGLSKLYKGLGGQEKDVGRQVRRQYSGMRSRLESVGLQAVQVAHLLVLPDQVVALGTVGFARERMVDAKQMDNLCGLVRQACASTPLANGLRPRLLAFLTDRFALQPDPSTHIGQLQRASRVLAEGLATWVPRIQHAAGVYVVEATAGSGKTQLALSLLHDAAQRKLQAAYLCYNRPLADHMAQVAPAVAQVSTFHEACVDFARRRGAEPDFASPKVFDDLAQGLIDHADTQAPGLDLLVIDESQDFDPQWVQALLPRLKDDGRLYILGDSHQQVYQREAFDLRDAVQVRCMDNFRSPHQVVQTINRLGLCPLPALARSVLAGETPGMHTYAAHQLNCVTVVARCVAALRKDGFAPDQIAVLTFAGRGRSQVLAQTSLDGLQTRTFTGQYDKAGNALWTDGALLVETLYRFKGQSAPAVVLCEVDFEALTDQELRKLFVGFTRAQVRLECVLSERAGQLLMARLE